MVVTVLQSKIRSVFSSINPIIDQFADLDPGRAVLLGALGNPVGCCS